MSTGIQILGDGRPDGSSVGASSTELAGMHGVVSAQYSAISQSVTSITSSGITALVDNLVATVSSIRALCTAKGFSA